MTTPGTSGFLQSEHHDYWVSLHAPVTVEARSLEDYEKLGGLAQASLMTNERLKDVSCIGDGQRISDDLFQATSFSMQAVVHADGLWNALTTAATEFFPIFEAEFGHGPNWTETRVKRLSDRES